MLRNYFDYVFLAPKAQGSIRSKLDPKPTRKARPDLRLWCMSFQDAPAFYVFNILLRLILSKCLFGKCREYCLSSCTLTRLGCRCYLVLFVLVKNYCIVHFTVHIFDKCIYYRPTEQNSSLGWERQYSGTD